MGLWLRGMERCGGGVGEKREDTEGVWDFG